MTDPVDALSKAMNNDLLQLRAASQNLANINTQGYKREIISIKTFDQVMNTNQSQGIQKNGEALPIRPGNGLPEVKQVYDYQQGTLKYTGSNFDIGLEGKGFLSIESQGQQVYTRKGHMRIDKEGALTLLSGEPIMGESGKIYLNMAPFSISHNGEVIQKGNVVDRLKLTEFEDLSVLENMGHSFFQVKEGETAVSQRSSDTQIMQGYVETSNVNQMDEMVNLINITRHFEASSKVLQGYDDMMDSAINVIGDL